MKLLLGMLIVLASVLGGYVLSHGRLMALFQPFELLIILGAALGAFVISNPIHVIRRAAASLPRLLLGAGYKRKDYAELLQMLYEMLSKARIDGLLSLENDIDSPRDSALFQKFPSVYNNHHAIEFLADAIRLMLSGSVQLPQLEAVMDLALETHHQEALQPSDAVNHMADALPGFGIVAAVMGVVITMGALDQPPEVLGDHIAAALVGTFVGILLAYGFVGPMATALHHQAEDQGKYLECIKACLLASLQGYSPILCVEFGRKSLPSNVRPAYQELEQQLRKPNGS
jgi:chemotaxis protein MotA